MTTAAMRKFRRRFLPLTTATIVAAGCVAVGTQSASAQTSHIAQAKAPAASTVTIPTSTSQVCLANSSGACVGFPVQDVVSDVISAAGVAAAWVAIFFQWIKKGTADDGPEGEEKDEGAAGDGDPDAGLCLADTGGDAYMTSCGANGTIWIAIPHNDGVCLYSRFTVDNGNPKVLTADPVKDGAPLFAALAAPSGGAEWQTWNWYSTSHK